MSDPIRRFGDLLVEMGLVTEGQVQQALALQPLTGTRVGEALLSLGFLTRAQLQRALSLALQRGEAVVLDRPPLGEILMGLRYASDVQVTQGLEAQQKTGKRIGEVLVDQGVINHQQLYEAVGLQRRMAPFKSSDSEHSAPGALGPGNGLRLVVIDDSDIASTLVREGLAAQGYDVTCFHDPFVALEQVDLLKPDLVLTDLDMPGLDGCEVCHRLKHSPSRAIPVIILTGNDADSRMIQGLREGADDYVHKSVSMEELSARIENVLRHSQETEKMRRLFARYTSDAVVDQILKTGDVVLSGERREVTVLFADIRSFTKFAELRTPEEVMRLLNEVLGRLADAVLEWGGTLDKFLGDGLMAVWGAPVYHDDDAAAAVSAALAMNDALTLFHQEHPENPRLELGIGLNSGPVVAGSLGSTRRTEYTCIGDTVNVASRLCSIAGPGEIFVGEGTAQALASIGPLEPLAAVKVKGRSVAVPIFRLTSKFREALAARNRF